MNKYERVSLLLMLVGIMVKVSATTELHNIVAHILFQVGLLVMLFADD